MTEDQSLQEIQQILENVCDTWCPKTYKYESFNIRMMRSLLEVNAYTQDVNRVLARKTPIRTAYPIPLPPIPPRDHYKEITNHRNTCLICKVEGPCEIYQKLHDEFSKYMKSI